MFFLEAVILCGAPCLSYFASLPDSVRLMAVLLLETKADIEPIFQQAIKTHPVIQFYVIWMFSGIQRSLVWNVEVIWRTFWYTTPLWTYIVHPWSNMSDDSKLLNNVLRYCMRTVIKCLWLAVKRSSKICVRPEPSPGLFECTDGVKTRYRLSHVTKWKTRKMTAKV